MISFPGIGASVALLLTYYGRVSAQLDRTGWTVSVDSAQGTWNPASYAIDGDASTFWHTQWTPSTPNLPHNITIDMKAPRSVSALTYLPRQDGNRNGNIGTYAVDVSVDNKTWQMSVASGNWIDDSVLKKANFAAQTAQYIRLRAITEAGGRGQWTSAAEINVLPPAEPSKGIWSAPFNTPLVAAAGAVLPTTGKVLLWSAQFVDHFNGTGNTETATYDPSTKQVSSLSLSNTNHDMFCPGISLDVNGNVVVTGGNNAAKTSIYDSKLGQWTGGPDMKVQRGYQSQTTLSNGKIFTIGGSWSGNGGTLRNGEIFDGTWNKLDGCPVSPMLTQDQDVSNGVNWRRDNHGWLFGWKDGSVFQAGPSRAMNWYTTTTTTGNQSAAGDRLGDADAMNGNAVMYDAVAGQILSVGGAPNYENKTGVNYVTAATTNANIITINAPNTTVKTESVAHMAYPRAFHNSVVLPDGSVFVTGGMQYPKPFQDDLSAFAPELWNSTTRTFTTMNPMSIPRNYHSIALLLPDATVFTAGGGLCYGPADSCTNNHFDAEIFSPPYLFNATDGSAASRPKLTSVSSLSFPVGTNLTVSSDSEIKQFSLVRFASATHSVNTDQRRIPIQPVGAGQANNYTVAVPSDAGVALPGYWMLFGINGAGVPSVATTVQIRTV
ncbi:MAG: hypothetical protein HETSPECPRED_008480 [Heterodermia speciosa]|uniref:F5/8 type C domain-containing protein n=1 Tax=Heterodermia speciosa TaxID=116794 RepID=A0A8H3FVC4_9LECA|nr:MAG: hypothetical protein HETSPECPRED_008480 [Heterodermia speciosa]